MNSKIKNYIEMIFSDVPRSKKAMELKEELLANLNDRYEDNIRMGRSETESYGLAVASMGDVDELIKDVMPDADFKNQAQFYRKRNAKNMAIAISLYIIGAAVMIAFGGIGDEIFNNDILAIVGVVILLTLAAVATGIIVFTNMSTPVEFKDYDEKSKAEKEIYKTPEGKAFEAVKSVYWSVITIIYLAISFLTSSWHLSWIIWPLAGVFFKIIETVFELKNTK